MKARNIICPVDFSDASQAALDLASKLARENDAKIYIVHVEENAAVAHPGLFGGLPPINWPTRQKLSAILPTATEVLFEHDLLFGDPAEAITDFAKRKNADLIVMGTHGNTGVLRVLLGSVAEAVVRTATIPVLTLKASTAEIPEDENVPPTDATSEAGAAN